MRSFAAWVLVWFAIAGCSTAGDSGAETFTGSPAAPSDLVPTPGSPPVPAVVPSDQVGTVFMATSDLVRSQTTPIESWSLLSPTRIAVHFVNGSPECYGADIAVGETEDSVFVTVTTGTLASAADKSCIMIAVYGTMEIELESPLGNRTVLNGM